MLSVLCPLKSGRQIAFGGTRGSIHVICAKTSITLETLHGHKSEIVSSSTVQKITLYTLSRDGTMISHGRSTAKPEINVDLKEELRNWFITAKVSELENSLENDVLGIAYSWNLAMIAAYDSNGVLSFWDASSFKLLTCLVNQHEADITMAKFLDPYPILVSVGNDGAMKMYTVRHYPYTCVMQAYNVIWRR